MILLPAITSKRDVEKIARKLLDAFREPFTFDDHEQNVTASIGVTIYPEDGGDADALINNADTAMYLAKDDGRNNYRLYETGKESVFVWDLRRKSTNS